MVKLGGFYVNKQVLTKVSISILLMLSNVNMSLSRIIDLINVIMFVENVHQIVN